MKHESLIITVLLLLLIVGMGLWAYGGCEIAQSCWIPVGNNTPPPLSPATVHAGKNHQTAGIVIMACAVGSTLAFLIYNAKKKKK